LPQYCVDYPMKCTEAQDEDGGEEPGEEEESEFAKDGLAGFMAEVGGDLVKGVFPR